MLTEDEKTQTHCTWRETANEKHMLIFRKKKASFFFFHKSIMKHTFFINWLDQVKTRQVTWSQVKSRQVKTNQVKSSQVKSSTVNQVKPSQVKSRQAKPSKTRNSSLLTESLVALLIISILFFLIQTRHKKNSSPFTAYFFCMSEGRMKQNKNRRVCSPTFWLTYTNMTIENMLVYVQYACLYTSTLLSVCVCAYVYVTCRNANDFSFLLFATSLILITVWNRSQFSRLCTGKFHASPHCSQYATDHSIQDDAQSRV